MYNPKNIKVINKRDVNNLHPTVKNIAINFINKANALYNKDDIEIKIIATLRDWQEQQNIYNQGRTTLGPIVSNATPGNSIHNWGCAFDVGIFKNNIYLDNTDVKKAEQIHKEISKIGKSLGLVWGGDFTSPKDFPHYQFTGKYSNNEFLNKVKNGVSIDDLLDPLGAFIKGVDK